MFSLEPPVFSHMNIDKFKKAFEYPFSFIDTIYDDNYKDIRYNIENISCTMFDETMKPEPINLKHINFPDDIENVYYFEEGENDFKPWNFIGNMKCKNECYYVHYNAECDYTGFDCQGMMRLYISKYLDRIIKFAVDDKFMQMYIKHLGDIKNDLIKLKKTKRKTIK